MDWNKANPRDLIAATSLAILLQLDSNPWNYPFFKIWHLTLKKKKKKRTSSMLLKAVCVIENCSQQHCHLCNHGKFSTICYVTGSHALPWLFGQYHRWPYAGSWADSSGSQRCRWDPGHATGSPGSPPSCCKWANLFQLFGPWEIWMKI